ncbi:MAG: formimidoylglutamase [Bacteroidota bacterium]
MRQLKPYFKHDVLALTRKRQGEEKLGELVDCVIADWMNDLKSTRAKFVLLGIPEDIGVRANYGRAGAASAFRPALESFLSQQHNVFLNASSVFVLGEVYVDDLMEQAAQLNVKQKSDMVAMRNLVAMLDDRVIAVIEKIVMAGKIPIVIGGGHNNAYGLIKGSSKALKQKISVINCDAHLDFRDDEGRHSGNAFSCAYAQGALKKYAVVGMHEQYNNQFALNQFKKNADELFYASYESIFVREDYTWAQAIKKGLGFIDQESCGIEIDLDAITNVPSSAKTSSGISPVQARQFAHHSANKLHCVYLHIAEGAPVLSHLKADNKTGKLIAYLVSDFIKACSLNKD